MRSIAAVILLACLALLALPAAAQTLSPLWWSLDAGGTYIVAGGYQLGATLGQPDAVTVSGGWYTLRGGYWPGAIVRHIVAEVPLPGGSVLAFGRQFTYGQSAIVAAALVVSAIWLRRGRRVTA